MADPNAWSLWYDHSTSGVGGWVLTVPNQHGFFITSFLSTVVTIAGASAWNIVSLLLHAHLARQGRITDIFGLQQQVALRNAPSGVRAAYDALALLSAWRHTPSARRLRRTAIVAVPGILVWAAFFAASLLTSLATNNSTDRAIVQMQPYRCGFQVDASDDSDDGIKLHESIDKYTFTDLKTDRWANRTVNARAYALSLHSGDAGARSSIYMNPKLNYTLETGSHVPCGLPNATYCLNQINATIRLTSQRIDSHADLGINAPPADRVAFQHRATCSVVDDGWFQTKGSKYIGYWLGPVGNATDHGSTLKYALGYWNSTIGYQIRAYYAHTEAADKESVWRPIDGIRRTDADQGVIFLSQNGVRYSQRVHDPFFIAEMYAGPWGKYRYKRNSFVSTMVCAEQHRWCRPNGEDAEDKDCTSWDGLEAHRRAGFGDGHGEGNTLGFSSVQRATAARLSMTNNSPRIIDSPVDLNTAALFASSRVRFNFESAGLPPDQWHKEISGWFETTLAGYQAMTNNYAHKSTNLDAFKVLSPFDTADTEDLVSSKMWFGLTRDMIPALQAQCGGQLVEDAVHIQNFSVVGVIVILAVSWSLVATSFWFVAILDFVSALWHHHRRRRQGYSGLEGADAQVGAEGKGDDGAWEESQSKVARQADDKMHLLRFALEASSSVPGHGHLHHRATEWRLTARTEIPVLAISGDDEEIQRLECQITRPVMKDGESLASYHVEDGAGKEIGTMERASSSRGSSVLSNR